MEKLKIAYDNFIKNDLQTCKKAAKIVAILSIIAPTIVCVSALAQTQISFAWFLGTLTTIIFSYGIGYALGYVPAVILYYLMELFAPRQGKSYLPGEKEDNETPSVEV